MTELFSDKLAQAGQFFVYNFIELTVLFLGVSFLVEVLNLLLKPEKVQRVLSSSKGGYLISSILGAITPFCSCSSIPITLGLLKARASFGPIMTFLFTSPLLNPIVVAVFWSVFGYEVTLIYGFIAFFVSILAGFVLEKLGFEKFVKKEIFEADNVVTTCSSEKEAKSSSCCNSEKNIKEKTSCCSKEKEEEKTCCKSEKKEEEQEKTSCCSSKEPVSSCCSSSNSSNMSKKALMFKTWKQFLSFAPYIAIGIGIGAFVHGFVPEEWLTTYAGADNTFAVPTAAIIGIPLYIRAASMVGLAPALLAKGVSMGAILALTVAGAGASLPEMVMLKKIFKLPIMIVFVFTVFTMAIGCGYLVNLYFAQI